MLTVKESCAILITVKETLTKYKEVKTMTNIYDDVVRNNIKKIIKQKGYKQCCVAEKAGIERNLFYRLLSNQAFDSKYIIPICKALNCKPNELFKYEETKSA